MKKALSEIELTIIRRCTFLKACCVLTDFLMNSKNIKYFITYLMEVYNLINVENDTPQAAFFNLAKLNKIVELKRNNVSFIKYFGSDYLDSLPEDSFLPSNFPPKINSFCELSKELLNDEEFIKEAETKIDAYIDQLKHIVLDIDLIDDIELTYSKSLKDFALNEYKFLYDKKNDSVNKLSSYFLIKFKDTSDANSFLSGIIKNLRELEDLRIEHEITQAKKAKEEKKGEEKTTLKVDRNDVGMILAAQKAQNNSNPLTNSKQKLRRQQRIVEEEEEESNDSENESGEDSEKSVEVIPLQIEDSSEKSPLEMSSEEIKDGLKNNLERKYSNCLRNSLSSKKTLRKEENEEDISEDEEYQLDINSEASEETPIQSPEIKEFKEQKEDDLELKKTNPDSSENQKLVQEKRFKFGGKPTSFTKKRSGDDIKFRRPMEAFNCKKLMRKQTVCAYDRRFKDLNSKEIKFDDGIFAFENIKKAREINLLKYEKNLGLTDKA
ncbi:MAG: hypothetical protein MJ252_11655 [archaeon]|nr:hypothetical protein [archaeon]